MDRIAFLVSAITSPFLVVGVTAVLLVVALRPGWVDLLVWAGILGFFSAVVPFLAVYVMWRAGRVTDMHVALREQRTVPFAAALISVSVGVAVLHVIGAPDELVALGAAFLVNGAILAAISLRWKASVHAATYAGCALGLSLVASPAFLYLLLGLPLVFWARLHRGRHTLAQGIVPVCIVLIVTLVAYHGVLALTRA